MSHVQVQARATPLSRALAVAGASVLAAFGALAVTLAFLWPPDVATAPRIELGRLADLPEGSAAPSLISRTAPFRSIHVVRPASGPPCALAGRARLPYAEAYGCSVPWRPQFVYRGVTGWFRDPCHGQPFDLAGNCQSPACTRALDRVRLDVRADGELILYPDQILRAPERGWPPEDALRVPGR